MDESQLHEHLDAVRLGRLSRRAFVSRLAALGIGSPMANLLLADAGLAQMAAPAPAYTPTRRGGGGALRLLMWQGPTVLNPHFAVGVKDVEGSMVFYEPLVRWSPDGLLLPVLAAAIPSRENGGVAADGRSVIWTLKRGVRWHDGAPFSADDVLFNWQYATDRATASTRAGAYLGLRLEKVDSHTVRVVFDKPTPFWPGAYSTVPLVPRHLFAASQGSQAKGSPHNLAPVGTGPYRFVDFRPGDLLRARLNPDYHQDARPHFDTLELKGGGDATSAARAVLQTGEFDYGWNLLVEDEVLRRIESTGGKGRVVVSEGGTVEFIQLAYADPALEHEGERAHPDTRHPVFTDAAVRQAIALLIDRASIQAFVFGRGGVATANILNNPARFRSPNMQARYDLQQANALLDAAGWRRGGDGIRAKDGRTLRFVFQSSINPARQKVQTIVKQALAQAGMALELKAVQASVFFGSDVANPDTVSKFRADMQMYAFSMGEPDPARFMDQYVSWEFARRANQWQGRNISRWRSAEYDTLYRAAESELDPARRAAQFIRMNDLVCQDQYLLPLVYRPRVAALGKTLVMPLSGWSEDMGALPHAHRGS